MDRYKKGCLFKRQLVPKMIIIKIISKIVGKSREGAKNDNHKQTKTTNTASVNG